MSETKNPAAAQGNPAAAQGNPAAAQGNPAAAVRIVESQGGRGCGLVAATDIKSGDICCVYSRKFTSGYITAGTIADWQYQYNVKSGCYTRDDQGSIGCLINDYIDPSVIDELRTCSSVEQCQSWADAYEQAAIAEGILSAVFAAQLDAKKAITEGILSAAQLDRANIKKTTDAGTGIGIAITRPGGPNVEFVEVEGEGKGLFVRALRDIPSGADLFHAYGASYWIGMISIEPATKPMTRLACVGHTVLSGSFPALGMVKNIDLIMFPTHDEIGPILGVMTPHEMPPETELTSKKINADAASWLHAVGLSCNGIKSLDTWFNVCKQVGMGERPKADWTASVGAPADDPMRPLIPVQFDTGGTALDAIPIDYEHILSKGD